MCSDAKKPLCWTLTSGSAQGLFCFIFYFLLFIFYFLRARKPDTNQVDNGFKFPNLSLLVVDNFLLFQNLVIGLFRVKFGSSKRAIGTLLPRRFVRQFLQVECSGNSFSVWIRHNFKNMTDGCVNTEMRFFSPFWKNYLLAIVCLWPFWSYTPKSLLDMPLEVGSE